MSTVSFPKESRLLNAADFLYLKKGANKVREGRILLIFKKNQSNKKEMRLGLSVSKKIGCAVVRNRVKRILRESFRHFEMRTIALDVLVVFLPTKSGKKEVEGNNLIREDFLKALRKVVEQR